MSKEEYKAYTDRAEFSPFTTRTAEGVHGMMLAKYPSVNVPDQYLDYLNNIDGKGSNLYKFISDNTWSSLITYYGGVLIDAPNGEEMSLAQAEENGISPYCTYYEATNIINVQTETVGRKEIIKLIVLHTKEAVQTIDKYTTELKDRYRVLEIDENGIYKNTLYDENEQILSESYPKKFGKTMNYIPFYFLPNRKPAIPLFKALADVNISWYHKSADLENGLHWTGVPTPYAIGYEPETITDDDGNIVPKNPVRLGGNQFVFFPMGVSQVGFLEFSGAGLSNLMNAMSADEERMAILGARIISAEKKGVESAETARIHRAGENSVIATFANEMSAGFSAMLKDYLEWSVGTVINDDISVSINTDYDTSRMNPQELTALVSLWQSGGISKQIMFNNLKEGEIIPSEITYEDMEEQIGEEKENQVTVQPIENGNTEDEI